MLNFIRKAILATDLARFFKNRKELELHLEEKQLDVVKNPSHRDLMLSLVMTGCDVASSAKQWDVHRTTTMAIIQEFYQQVRSQGSSNHLLVVCVLLLVVCVLLLVVRILLLVVRVLLLVVRVLLLVVCPPAGRVCAPAGRVCPPAGRVCAPAGRVCPPAGRVCPPAGRVCPPAGRVCAQCSCYSSLQSFTCCSSCHSLSVSRVTRRRPLVSLPFP